jgi:hypothetical protein
MSEAAPLKHQKRVNMARGAVPQTMKVQGEGENKEESDSQVGAFIRVSSVSVRGSGTISPQAAHD